MRDTYAPRSGPVLIKTPSHRQRMLQRRVGVVCGLLALALASGLIGSLAHPRGEAPGRPQTGPFSYFPAE